MHCHIIPVTPFAQNCTLLFCEKTRQAVVVDPGGEIDRIIATAGEIGVTIVKILITHGHIDHAGGAAELKDRLGVPIEGPHADDQFWIDGMAEQSRQFGFSGVRGFTPDRWLQDGDQIDFGEVTLKVIHCPGHTPGHVVFFDAESRIAQVGDVLFQGSIGRTDFPRGDYNTLISSICKRLFPLGDDVTFIPGHGPSSTFGEERVNNPFVGGRYR